MNLKGSFIKFPSTPHLIVLDGVSIREDKVLGAQERNTFLDHDVAVEEKIDGANLGISFNSEGIIQAQNRGSLLQEPMSGQWKALPDWLRIHGDRLFDVLTDRYILFGEWCYAKHSVFYDSLPDWFIGFDVFDLKVHRFVCRQLRNEILLNARLRSVPCLASGRLSIEEIIALLGRSRFGQSLAEGLYIRRDDGDWLSQRAKLVRPDFIQSIDEHWSNVLLELNSLAIHQPQGLNPA